MNFFSIPKLRIKSLNTIKSKADASRTLPKKAFSSNYDIESEYKTNLRYLTRYAPEMSSLSLSDLVELNHKKNMVSYKPTKRSSHDTNSQSSFNDVSAIKKPVNENPPRVISKSFAKVRKKSEYNLTNAEKAEGFLPDYHRIQHGHSISSTKRDSIAQITNGGFQRPNVLKLVAELEAKSLHDISNQSGMKHELQRSSTNGTDLSYSRRLHRMESTPLCTPTQNTGAHKSSIEGCYACQRRVYCIDRVANGDRIYHKACFRCSHCNRVLQVGHFSSIGGLLFCEVHNPKAFHRSHKHDPPSHKPVSCNT